MLRVNYTTYDVRRDQDSMNPRTHCDVMVLSPDTDPEAHPYWYARVLGVFHARVLHTGPASTNRSVQHVEFLWVRWFSLATGHRYGFKAARLPKIGFVPQSDQRAFGFLDPSLIVRGSHLIPAFAGGRTTELLANQYTAARPPGETDDWVAFYVNMYVQELGLHSHPHSCVFEFILSFVDRDMFMRYLGGGIGHIQVPDRNIDSEDEMEGEELQEGDADMTGKGDEYDTEDEGDEDSEDGEDSDSSSDGDLGPEDGEGDGEGDEWDNW